MKYGDKGKFVFRQVWKADRQEIRATIIRVGKVRLTVVLLENLPDNLHVAGDIFHVEKSDWIVEGDNG